MSLLASTLPQNTGSGYVAAAYIVFFAIVLIYVVIMAVRLGRVERGLRDLRAPSERQEAPAGQAYDGVHTTATAEHRRRHGEIASEEATVRTPATEGLERETV